MALQTQRLVMVGLGVQDDHPPNDVQPPLADGIHLRWAFQRGIGFPWYGFYLFRRSRRIGDPICLSAFTRLLQPGLQPGGEWASPIGRVASDTNLSLTDDFPPPAQSAGDVEFDLEHRGSLSFLVLPGQPVRRVAARIGFRAAAQLTVTALLWGVPVAETTVAGTPGQVVAATLLFDAITEVRFGPAPAALVELCVVPVEQDARSGWTVLAPLRYPLRLPLTHPGYPCTPGVAESLAQARQLAKQRIAYGDPDRLTQPGSVRTAAGTVRVAQGSPLATGAGTDWGPHLVGHVLQVAGDATAYCIVRVLDTGRLVLTRPYAGASQPNAAYTIRADPFGGLHDTLAQLVGGGPAAGPMADRMLPTPVTTAGTVLMTAGSPVVEGSGTQWSADWSGLDLQLEGEAASYTIAQVDAPTRLTLARAYPGPSGGGRPYRITPRLQAHGASGTPPALPRQRLLDLVLLASLDPAAAQLLGLYWTDTTVAAGVGYDYLLAAVQVDLGGLQPQLVLDHIDQHGFDGIDGYIVFNQAVGAAAPLAPPRQLQTRVLPGTTVQPAHGGEPVDATSNVGLTWNLGRTEEGALVPGRPVMYHLWRDRQDDAQEPFPGQHTLLTRDSPLLVRAAVPDGDPERPGDWPAEPVHAIDRAVPDGVYSYQVSGIDLFGRHTPNSAPAVVEVRDRIPPPPPSGIEASALDRDDPTLVRDATYLAWRDALDHAAWYQALPEDERRNLIGLRVSWLWTASHERQARDLREFRIYYQPAPINARFGRIMQATTAGADESEVDTDIDNAEPAGAWTGAWLHVGPHAFRVTSSAAGSPLRLRVRSSPTHTAGTLSADHGAPVVRGDQTGWDRQLTGLTLRVDGEPAAYTILHVDAAQQELALDRPYAGPTGQGRPFTISGRRPPVGARCTVALPPPFSSGAVAVSQGSRMVHGAGTRWSTGLAGLQLAIDGEAARYRIASIDAEDRLTLQQAYGGVTGVGKAYQVLHPLAVDYADRRHWRRRFYVVGSGEHVTRVVPPLDGPDGRPLRGEAATVAGSVVTLDGGVDLSGLRPGGELFVPHLYLANDQAATGPRYRIVEVDAAAQRVTVAGQPALAGPTSPWSIGWPARRYEVLLPRPDGLVPHGLPLHPTLEEPIANGHVGVSAADDQQHTADDAIWSQAERGDWDPAQRYGNEGSVGGPRQVFRVRHEPPPAPRIPVFDSDRVWASPADYHGRSFYTVRWVAETDPADPNRALPLGCHVFRALDDTLFRVDWRLREPLGEPPRPLRQDLAAEDLEVFPPELRGDQADLRRQQVVADLNALNQFGRNAPGREQALAHYRQLPNDALRVLAGLPGSESAFAQRTIQPLDPDEPDPTAPGGLRWRRVGPDVAPGSLGANERVWVDTLDGRCRNRYFYRMAFVDGAHNRGPFGFSTPPVWLPDVVAPRTPLPAGVTGGDGEVVLRWASNREPDLAAYRIYRADTAARARDLRLMDLVQTVNVSAGDPATRPARVEWRDMTVVPYVEQHYRITAVDSVGNQSPPTAAVLARAYSTLPPDPPAGAAAQWVGVGGDRVVRVTWTVVPGVAVLVQRRVAGTTAWRTVGTWSAPGVGALDDAGADPAEAHDYRLRARDLSGRLSELGAVIAVAAGP